MRWVPCRDCELVLALTVAIGLSTCAGCGSDITGTEGVTAKEMVVFGYNDLGMHCLNEDFSALMILPPYNTLHAQVIRRGAQPHILTRDVTVTYSVPGNTRSVEKTNFWDYAEALLGAGLADDVGLAGNGLSGELSPTGDNDWSVVGIPLTPITDAGELSSYQLASITVTQNGTMVAETRAVVPVSWEMRCDLCHTESGISTDEDILEDHDRLHGTLLVNDKPVLCASCHADPALGLEGDLDVSTLSAAMHASHFARMAEANLTDVCYACHPGIETQCLRDVHFSNGMDCMDCHGDMSDIGSVDRRPWMDLPRCDECHGRAGFEFEQPGVLYRDSKGHNNVHCAACHGSPHAIAPSVVDADNIQSRGLQGHAGVIDTCRVCHNGTPFRSFFHRVAE